MFTKNDEVANKVQISYTYDEAVELAGNGKYNIFLLVACSIISMAVALDTFGFSVIVATSNCDLELTMKQKGLLASIPFAGLLFSYIWGYIADTRGRRPALICSTAVGFACAALSSLAPTWHIMGICKFIGASFSTSAFTLTITMLGECTGTKHRARYLQIMNSVNLAAEIFIFGLAYLLLKLEFSVPIPWLAIAYRPWRLLTFFFALPLGAGALMMLYFHESPKFLANQGNFVKALEALQDIYVVNGGTKEEYQVKMLSSQGQDASTNLSFFKSIWVQTVPIFRPPLLWHTLKLYYIFIIICSTNNVFVMWFPMIVNSFFFSLEGNANSDQGFCQRVVTDIKNSTNTENFMTPATCNDTIADYTVVAGLSASMFLTTLTLLISRVASKRKLVLFVILSGTAISAILVNVVPPLAGMVFFILLQVPAVCIGTTASFIVDLYPTSYRGMATSLGFMIARTSSLAGVNLIGAIIMDYCEFTFYLTATFVISGLIVTLFLPRDKIVRNRAR